MFMKVASVFPPGDREQVEEIVQQVTNAKNALLNQDGHSPHQRVFGQQARFLEWSTGVKSPCMWG